MPLWLGGFAGWFGSARTGPAEASPPTRRVAVVNVAAAIARANTLFIVVVMVVSWFCARAGSLFDGQEPRDELSGAMC
jgi:hypothetical protein